jgi:regulator of replication initiation timing
MIWTNEIISAELDKCEQSADVAALMRAMRDEYEKEIGIRVSALSFLNTTCGMQFEKIAELESQLAAAAVEVAAIRDQVILSHEEEQRRFVELEKQHGVLDRVITTNNALYLHEYNRATTAQSARIAELEAQLAAALATIEQATTPDEWQDKPFLF